ncbi:MAG: hypothetical protein Q7S27_05415 [Nanoarchaeota archaeon]|nr:hypothetical protein [Nanoarchaeota archaeon]
MEEEQNNTVNNGKKSNKLIWIVSIVIILGILFFAFKGGDKEESNINDNDQTADDQEVNEIDGLDVGDNPDIGVDDFNSLLVSQEEIAG